MVDRTGGGARGSPLRFAVASLLLRGAGAWKPDADALAATAGREVRVLHRHAKSNAFLYFHDADDEAAAYGAATPTEADAVEVTGQVTGFNVALMEALAARGGFTVRYFVMCAESYDCAANQTAGLIPKGTEDFMRYFQDNMTTFDAVVSSFPMTSATLPYLSWLEPPSLRTGWSAFARARGRAIGYGPTRRATRRPRRCRTARRARRSSTGSRTGRGPSPRTCGSRSSCSSCSPARPTRSSSGTRPPGRRATTSTRASTWPA